MNHAIITIMKKELARFFGDRRLMISTIILPGLLIYLMYNFMGSAITNQFTAKEDFKPTMSAVYLPDSVKAITDKAGLTFTEIAPEELEQAKTAIAEQEQDLCIVFPQNFDNSVAQYSILSGVAAPAVSVYYNTSSVNSDSAFTTLQAILDQYEASIANKFDINPAAATVYDLASEKDITGTIFSSMLPMLLMIFMFSGCMAVAPESIAGEKERGTIATLLVTPTKRSSIAIGKILALSVVALLGGISSTLGTVLSLPKLMGGAAEQLSSNVYTVTDYLLLGVIILSTVLVLICLISIVSAFAKTAKEAQTYVMPLMVLVMLIGITAMFGGGAKTELWYYCIPLYNSVQCMVGIFSFAAVPTNILLAVGSNLLLTVLGVFVLTRMFNSERIVFSK